MCRDLKLDRKVIELVESKNKSEHRRNGSPKVRLINDRPKFAPTKLSADPTIGPTDKTNHQSPDLL